MAGKGGATPGAGRKPGKANARTIQRMAAKRQLIERTIANTDKIFNAQLDKAVGEKFLFVKVTEYATTKDGKRGKIRREYHEVVEDSAQIIAFLDGELDGGVSLNDKVNQTEEREEFYFISTKSADSFSLANMLDRAYGKPTEKVDIGTGDNDLSDLDDEELERKINERIDVYLASRRKS